jgi:hypothetical protein
VGFLDALLGRTKPVPPNLDALFALPSAAITLQAATDFTPTGNGSVCFRAAEGRAFSDIEKEVRELLNMGDNKAPVDVSQDSYGAAPGQRDGAAGQGRARRRSQDRVRPRPVVPRVGRPGAVNPSRPGLPRLLRYAR